MLLYKKGQETHFDYRLIKYMIVEKNYEVINILRCHNGNDTSPEWGQLIDSSGATLLHYAAEFGNSEITKFILKYGKCEIDAQDVLGRTPLMLAVKEEREVFEAFEILLKANADINLTDNEGKNTVQLIFELGPKCFKLLGKLFQHATWQKIIASISPEELAKKLDEVGLTSKDAFPWGNVELMKMLLSRENENTINARYRDDGKTMLHVAVKKNMIKIVKVLVDSGADVDALDDQYATPLFYLYERSCDKDSAEFLEMLKTLMSRATFLISCTDRGCMQISNALMFGSNDAIEIVLQANIDLNIKDHEGDTVLHYLAENVNADLFKLMRGRNFNVNVSNNTGCTPLHVAVTSGSLESVEFWLENEADVNNTPLDMVFSRYDKLDKKIVELLLHYGADPEVCLQHVVDIDWTTLNHLFNLFNVAPRTVESISIAKPILARLAIIRGLGLKITDRTRSEINRQPSWLKFFDNCQLQVLRMKETKVYGDLSLFEFLTESQKKMTAHVRNEELVSELVKAIEGFEVDSPYPELLRHRLVKARQLAVLREKAVNVVSSLIHLEMNAYYFFVDCIVDYLSNRDMEVLLLVWRD